MLDHLTLGPTPTDERCADIGADDYFEKSKEECRRYKELLEKRFPWENQLGIAYFHTKSFEHDFGTYREVVVMYDDKDPLATDFALHCEWNLPSRWSDNKVLPFNPDLEHPEQERRCPCRCEACSRYQKEKEPEEAFITCECTQCTNWDKKIDEMVRKVARGEL